jgi:hypothetical protein
MTQHESLNGKTEANDANPVSAPESNPKSGNLNRLKVIIIAVSVCAAGALIVLLSGKTPVSPSSLPLQDKDTTTATVPTTVETASWETEYEHLIEDADIYYGNEDYISAKMEYQKALSKIPATDAGDKRDAMTKKIADCEQRIKAEKESKKH